MRGFLEYLRRSILCVAALAVALALVLAVLLALSGGIAGEINFDIDLDPLDGLWLLVLMPAVAILLTLLAAPFAYTGNRLWQRFLS